MDTTSLPESITAIFSKTQMTDGHCRLAELSTRLRQELPEDFAWNFAVISEPIRKGFFKKHCGTAGCAIGLACHIWPEAAKRYIPRGHYQNLRTCMSSDTVMAKYFDMTVGDYCRIFMNSAGGVVKRTTYQKDLEFVEPTDVADAIDQYLRETYPA